MGDLVMTVNGPLAAEQLGVTDAHEHLFLRSPALLGDEIDDLDKTVAEVTEAQTTGLNAFVELTPIGLGRRPDLLREVMKMTGAPIIAASGYHRDAHYAPGHWVLSASFALLLDRIRTDLLVGMHPSDWSDASLPLDAARAGVIKAGASQGHITNAERIRLTCAAQASAETGAAIVVHTEAGTCGERIAAALEQDGVPADRVVLAHMDRNPKPALHLKLLSRGLFLVYDTPGRTRYHPDSARIDLIESVVTAGFGAQILLGLDLGRHAYYRSYGGGPGLRYLMATFVPELERRIGREAARRILVDNPARAFALKVAP